MSPVSARRIAGLPAGPFRNVFVKSLRDQRRALLGWSIGIVLVVGLMVALWPSVRNMPNLEQLMANYPEAMRKLFNVQTISTGTGYLNAELFSLIVPVLFIVFGIGRGARLIAGEEEAGTLDVLLVTPVSRIRLLLHQAAALVVGTLVLGLVLFGATVALAAALTMGVGVATIASSALAMALLGIEHGLLALAVGAVTGRRAVAVAAAASVAVLGYLLYVAGQLVDAVRPWRVISPFWQALHGGPLGAGWQVSYLWLAVGALVFVSLSLPVFDHRDIAAAR